MNQRWVILISHLIVTDPPADSKRSFKKLPFSKSCPINNMYKNIRLKHLCSKFDSHLNFNPSFDGAIKSGTNGDSGSPLPFEMIENNKNNKEPGCFGLSFWVRMSGMFFIEFI